MTLKGWRVVKPQHNQILWSRITAEKTQLKNTCPKKQPWHKCTGFTLKIVKEKEYNLKKSHIIEWYSTRFNIGLHKPQRDQCDFRIQFQSMSDEDFCLCWGFTAQSTQWGHVERSQFT